MIPDPFSRKPLRLWPGVMFAVAMVVLYFGAPMALPDAELPVGLMGVMIACDWRPLLVAVLQPGTVGGTDWRRSC